MSENESSYYEIALTNKQVVVFFVVLLCFVLVVFLSGVWVGKGEDSSTVVARNEAPLPGDESLDAVQELEFFAGAEGADLDKPDLGRLAAAPRRDTTLAQDVGSADPEPAPPRAQPRDEPARSTPPPTQSPPTQSAPPQAAPPQAAPPPSAPPRATAPAAGGFVIQVFSSNDQAQAQKVVGQLQGDGHRAFLDPVRVDTQTMYRVRLGPYAQRPEAERVADQVKRKFRLDTWITAAGG